MPEKYRKTMRQNDVMVGDLVYFKKKPMVVEGFLDRNDNRTILCSSVDSNLVRSILGYRCTELSPIPITDDFLFNNGFVRREIGHKDKYEKPLKGTDGYDGKLVYVIDCTYHLSIWKYGQYNTHSKVFCMEGIKYVHELQHAMKMCRFDYNFLI